MPRKRRAAPKVADAAEADRQEKLDAMIDQFHSEVKRRIYDMRRQGEQVISKIDSSFKLAKMKMSADRRDQLWEVAVKQSSADAQISEEAPLTEVERPGKRGGRGAAAATGSQFATPMPSLLPKHCSTPAITPKFDPRTVHLAAPNTIRQPRHRELLMSLHGSPVTQSGQTQPDADQEDIAPALRAVEEKLECLDSVEADTKQLIARLHARLGTYME